jgi:hypothetical protein
VAGIEAIGVCDAADSGGLRSGFSHNKTSSRVRLTSLPHGIFDSSDACAVEEANHADNSCSS